MELLMQTGKKTEKAGTLLREVSEPEKKTDSEILEQIDGKLDLLLAAGKAETGGTGMNTPTAIKIECAKGEIMNAMQHIQDTYALPPCIVDGIVSSVLAEVRAESKLELINATSAVMKETEEELAKAKAEAKKVLREEPEQVPESGMGQQGRNPEE